ncbi:MAG: hypothetical protein PVG78_10155 [Desulfobacterales bacterium]
MGEKRDAYVQQLKAKMKEWRAEIDRLTARAEQAEAQAKIEYQKRIDKLEDKRKDLEDKIDAFQQAGESSWENLKEGIDNSWKIFKMSLSEAKSEFERGYKEGKEN